MAVGGGLGVSAGLAAAKRRHWLAGCAWLAGFAGIGAGVLPGRGICGIISI